MPRRTNAGLVDPVPFKPNTNKARVLQTALYSLWSDFLDFPTYINNSKVQYQSSQCYDSISTPSKKNKKNCT